MKEILFKAKSIATGEWVEGSLIDSGNHEQVFIYPHFDGASTMSCRSLVYHRMIAVDPDTICQYTELNDKNGNKIWENDILCTNNKEKYIVKYRFGGFEMHHRAVATPIYAYAGTDLYINENTLNLQVIGNVFDNADLLKGE